jgi:hypothetical protein
MKKLSKLHWIRSISPGKMKILLLIVAVALGSHFITSAADSKTEAREVVIYDGKKPIAEVRLLSPGKWLFDADQSRLQVSKTREVTYSPISSNKPLNATILYENGQVLTISGVLKFKAQAEAFGLTVK